MFEIYDLNNIYKATIKDHGCILSIENIGGCIGFMSDRESKYYETLLYISNNKVIDINNPKRIMNFEIKNPLEIMPKTSPNKHLYTIVEESLVKYNSTITKRKCQVIKKTLFGNKLREK